MASFYLYKPSAAEKETRQRISSSSTTEARPASKPPGVKVVGLLQAGQVPWARAAGVMQSSKKPTSSEKLGRRGEIIPLDSIGIPIRSPKLLG